VVNCNLKVKKAPQIKKSPFIVWRYLDEIWQQSFFNGGNFYVPAQFLSIAGGGRTLVRISHRATS